MARSEIQTWLPLDDFAKILGIDPLGFNQLSSNTFRTGTMCGEVFFQYSWQHADRIGRDDLAMAIQQAEQDIAAEVGFNLLPDWTLEERLPFPRPGYPELYNFQGVNPRWMRKSVEARKGHMISGGVRASSVIQAGAAIVRSDYDGDTFAELCTVTVPTTVTDVNEIHAFYPAKNADRGWEIRPITVTLSGGNAIITFKVWQVVAANQMERLVENPLDADSASTFETTVDIYRIYNDSSTQAQFIWEDCGGGDCCGSCTACQLGTQAACCHTRDERLGIVVPSPASYDTSTGDWTLQDFSACREPDQIRLWYYSGWRNPALSRSYVELDTYWKYAIAYYAASKIDRPVCGCSNVKEFIDHWRLDAAFSSMEKGGFEVTAEQAANRLGTTMGALYAWRQIERNGIRVNK